MIGSTKTPFQANLDSRRNVLLSVIPLVAPNSIKVPPSLNLKNDATK